jgi:hypothetical protein
MYNDERLIAEAYTRIYHESDKEFAIDDLAAAASDYEQQKADEAEVNQEDEENTLKKYTYEILYKTDYKFDPKTKKPVSWSYKSHSSGRPDVRHIFAHSEDGFWNKIDRSGFGEDKEELRKLIVIKDVQPADPEEVEKERRHAETMHDYYHGPGSQNRYFGD